MDKLPLTKKEKELLDFVIMYNRTFGYMPTMRDMSEYCILRFPSSIQNRLLALIKKGYLQRLKFKKRALILL